MNPLKASYGFYRIAAAIPEVTPANPIKNIEHIAVLAKSGNVKGCKIMVFPELSISGYTCGDLFNQNLLITSCEEALLTLADVTSNLSITIIVGFPLLNNNNLYNCAAVLFKGEIIGIVPKSHIPNYSEFYEKRWFKSGIDIKSSSVIINGKSIPFGTNLIFRNNDGIKFGVEICEDLWIPNSPSRELTTAGAEIIFNLSATDEILGKHRYLKTLIEMQSASCRCCYAYSSAGANESSTDLVFSGNAILAQDGKILAETDRFSREERFVLTDFDIEHVRHDRVLYNSFNDNNSSSDFQIIEYGTNDTCGLSSRQINNNYIRDIQFPIDPLPFVPQDKEHLKENCEEIISIQSWGLEQRLLSTGCKALVIGISGGLDSTLALLIACHAFDRLGLPREGIYGITMPGEATSTRTFNNAWALMEELGISSIEIPIGLSVMRHFEDIGHDPAVHDATYENSQARERTQILMDMANKTGGMVLGTGDLSELALGWCTYNGDHMSMYAVNASIPKTLIRHLVNWFAETTDSQRERETLLDIIDTPISPELVPPAEGDKIEQKTEDLVGPYELHDFFLYHTLRHG